MVRRGALLGALLVGLGQPDRVHAQSPDTTHGPRPFTAFSNSAQSMRDSIVALARAQVGKKYVWGGTSPVKGFDCSGLVAYIMAKLNVDVPRTAAQQARVGRTVEKDVSHLRPGDLVTFGSSKRISHIGVYVGDGRFIHASTGAGKVVESRLLRPRHPGVKPWRGVRRLVTEADSTPADSTPDTKTPG
ncbi:MAG TPA: C40 family peptidase [Gemmatimonadaceae bacterium]|nr:C40 family peptidase [Gemmatimonadaceae bacterium]